MVARREFQFSNLTVFGGRYFRIPRHVLFADFPFFLWTELCLHLAFSMYLFQNHLLLSFPFFNQGAHLIVTKYVIRVDGMESLVGRYVGNKMA